VARPCVTADGKIIEASDQLGLAYATGQNFPMERPKSVTLLHVTLPSREELDSVLIDVTRH
jgi:uncharacterized membrane protein YobD (UPF0266 family)